MSWTDTNVEWSIASNGPETVSMMYSLDVQGVAKSDT